MQSKSSKNMLYFPLYNGIDKIAIGISNDAMLTCDYNPYSKPICIYGTSITQGGCASRPGMTYTAIIGRRLNREVINLGFSGNGKGEKEMAELMCELDVSMYVVDCLPNMNEQLVKERLEIFLTTLLKKDKNVPVLMVDNIEYQDSHIAIDRYERQTSTNGAMHKIVKNLMKSHQNLFLFNKSKKLLGNDGEGTVDGVHPTDLGFMRIANALCPVIEGILNSYKA